MVANWSVKEQAVNTMLYMSQPSVQLTQICSIMLVILAARYLVVVALHEILLQSDGVPDVHVTLDLVGR